MGRSRRCFDLVIVNTYPPHLRKAEALLHAVRELTGPGPLRDRRKPELER
jgi:hypothetical protein